MRLRPVFVGAATAIVLAIVALAGCTTRNQEAPPLSGPSEYGISVGISITPDVLTQDGASQSLITVSVRNADGAAMRNVSMRVEVVVGGVRADFGSLSARNLVTGSDGRATVVYTAPSSPALSVDTGTVVTIAITPVGSDFGNSTVRTASIRLVPPGVVVPPDGLSPAFTFTPTSPTDNQPVLFDASTSTSAAGNPIATYSWNFGDGERGSGRTTAHAFDDAGVYVVTLTITDGYGRSAQKAATVTVVAGAVPTAGFTFSPTDPAPAEIVNFNAAQSVAAPGRAIVSYRWDFGDGTFDEGRIASHAYNLARTYTVVLTVTDDAGKEGRIAQTVTVVAPK